MTFTIQYSDRFDRKKLMAYAKQDLKRIKDALEQKLMTYPDLFGKPLRNAMQSYWSLRVGDYRIIYRIEKTTVRILDIAHRSKVYREK
ncbi:MAG: type II toxin-antitoxin system RelE/ParE family toxin [Candidatus Peregrinibacteria bacterium]